LTRAYYQTCNYYFTFITELAIYRTWSIRGGGGGVTGSSSVVVVVVVVDDDDNTK
jgi:hypothetical protein